MLIVISFLPLGLSGYMQASIVLFSCFKCDVKNISYFVLTVVAILVGVVLYVHV